MERKVNYDYAFNLEWGKINKLLHNTLKTNAVQNFQGKGGSHKKVGEKP